MKRMLWFSPLPPAKTDIANYSARLAPHLSKRFDVTFCVPDGLPHAELPNVRPISTLSAKDLNGADLCVYQLGNNAQFHGQIFDWAQRHPGLVVLHDRSIHEFYLGHLKLWDGHGYEEKLDHYLETMAAWYGEDGYLAGEAICNGSRSGADHAEAYPLYETACANALGVLCHNPLVSAEVRQRFPLLEVLDLPLPYPIPEQEPVRIPCKDSGQIRLAAFGFMGANRRLLPFLNAWAASPWREQFHLNLAGEIADQDALNLVIKRHGLENQVLRHGFMSDERLDALLRSVDLVLNLRFPTMGEASGSQLRIWANGAASVVTDIGWYGQLPPETVMKIRPTHEHEDLLHLLEQLAHGQRDIAGVAAAGARQLALHDPAHYAETLAAWFEQTADKLKRNWFLRREIASIAARHAEMLPTDAFLSVPDLLYRLAR